MPKQFTYKGSEPKNFGRWEKIKPGQTITANDGRETSDLSEHAEFEAVEEKPAKPAK